MPSNSDFKNTQAGSADSEKSVWKGQIEMFLTSRLNKIST